MLKGGLSLVYILLLQFLFSQNYDWVTQTEGRGSSQIIDSKLDSDESMIMTGIFSDSIDFDPGLGEAFLYSSYVERSSFVQKIDQNGNFVWAQTGITEGTCVSTAVETDQDNNIYLFSAVSGSMQYDIDPSPAFVYVEGNSNFNTIVQKFDENGNLIWGFNFVDSTSLSSVIGVRKVTVDESNNLYMVGSFTDSIDFDPDPVSQYFLYSGNTGFDPTSFILKLNSDGEFQWVKSFPQAKIDFFGIVTGNNSIYVTGTITDSIAIIDSANVITSVISGQFDSDVLTMRFDHQGNFLSKNILGGTYSDAGQAIGLDSNNDVIVVGKFFDECFSGSDIIQSEGLHDLFVQKLDMNCNSVWLKGFGGPGPDLATDIAINQTDELIITGGLQEGPSSIYNLNSSGPFIFKLNSAGTQIGSVNIASWGFPGTSVHVTETFKIYCSGNFKYSISDSSSLIANAGYITSLGQISFYCLKMDETILWRNDFLPSENSINVFPNPSTGNLTLINEQNNQIELVLFDFSGREVSRIGSSKRIVSLDYNSMAKGAYLLSIIRLDGTRTIKKIILE